MAYINLLKQDSQPNHFIIIDRILCNQNFIDTFYLDLDLYPFRDTYDEDPCVKDLIKWIDDWLKNEKKQGYKPRFKYQIEPREFAVKKLLPKLKQWDSDMFVSIH
jgi:hypothetical protein